MKWVWQLASWPEYIFDANFNKENEDHFLNHAGILKGSLKHLNTDDHQSIQIELLIQEAINTSKIEGEILQRDSVQSSIRKHLGLHTGQKKFEPKAFGISEMMVDLYHHFDQSLNHHTLFTWHTMLCNGRRDIDRIGSYRTHREPMQIVSSNLKDPKLFYEAPPSNKVHHEMENYLHWFNDKVINPQWPALTFASLAHLYFEQIHPFEDGNGRIGRALAEKAISMRLGYPSLSSCSTIIESHRKMYYNEIQQCNHSLNTNSWINYFSNVITQGQQYSIDLVDFVIFKTKFFQRNSGMMNDRQKKVIHRIFDAGPSGFEGGLSAANYKAIAKTSTATTTRDLAELLELGMIERRGQLKGSRYYLKDFS